MGGCTHSQGTNSVAIYVCMVVKSPWSELGGPFLYISPYFAWSEKTVFSACKASISSSFPVWTGYAHAHFQNVLAS